jgi:hypothetical protein
MRRGEERQSLRKARAGRSVQSAAADG